MENKSKWLWPRFRTVGRTVLSSLGLWVDSSMLDIEEAVDHIVASKDDARLAV